MDKKQQFNVMEGWDARDIIRKGELTSELEFERAVWAERSLSLLVDEQPELENLRKDLFNLIVHYESLHWSDFDSIPKKQFTQSDKAERQVKKEFKFFKKRKELILKKLKQNGMNQNDLGTILAHNKSYISELLSGTRSFSINDLVIVHRLFDISLENLIYTEIPAEVERRINDAIEQVSVSKSTSKNIKVTSLAKSLSGF